MTFSIISPHAGTYNISVVSFAPSTPSLSLENATYFGKNLTLIQFSVGNDGFVIRVLNETSKHYINLVFIGSLPPPAWVVERPLKAEQAHIGNVPANGFQETVVIAVNGIITRYGADGSLGHVEGLGTMNAILTYHDVPLDRDFSVPFTVSVLLVS
jgi:hypothetical protein